MRRWGRVLRPPADGVFETALATNAPITVDLTVDDIPRKCGLAHPFFKEKAVAQSSVIETQTQSFYAHETGSGLCPPTSSPSTICPRVSQAFHGQLREGLKDSATVAGARHAQEERAQALATTRHSCSDGATLVWLRPFDLRLHDHPPLWYAAGRGRPVQVVFAWSDAEDAALGEWQIAGTAAAFWLHHAIDSLDASLRQKYGFGIAIRTSDTVASAVMAAALESGADEVVTSTSFEPVGPAGCIVEAAARKTVEAAGLKFKSFNSFLLHDINKVHVDMSTYRGHFGTLTPFHHACMSQPAVQGPTPEPPSLKSIYSGIANEGLHALGFARMPVRSDGSVVDWGSPILGGWEISEKAALDTLQKFLAPRGGLERYEKGRQLANASAVTRISPYLRFGMLSCRRMFSEMKVACAKEQSIVYWRRLIWRDLAYWQLSLFPRMRSEPIRAHYAGQTWNQDKVALSCWQKGETGFPIVDAGMRELWSTGWMAQNVRMVAAILLCEHLNIHWIEGERWFHHTLVDADSAINAMMWQNAGKSGLDQWNFSMSPAASGKTQDPTGSYVRKWCPELAKLPTKLLHTPWDAPSHVLREAGVSLGPYGNYPERIVVDLRAAAKISGDAIRQQRKRSVEWSNDQGYDLIVLPRGATLAHDGQKFRVFTVPQYRNANRHGSDADEWAVNPAPAKGRRKGSGRGKGHGKGAAPEAASVKTSHQSVLSEYMRASGC